MQEVLPQSDVWEEKHEKKICPGRKQLTSTWDFQKVVALFFFLAVTSARQTFGSWQHCNWLTDMSAHQ
jgi:hypothetical protein